MLQTYCFQLMATTALFLSSVGFAQTCLDTCLPPCDTLFNQVFTECIIGGGTQEVCAEQGNQARFACQLQCQLDCAIPIDLEFQSAVQTVGVNDPVPIRLRAMAQESPGQPIVSLTVILNWDPASLRLLGVTRSGEEDYPWQFCGFPIGTFDTDGLNNNLADGDAFLVCFALLPHIRPFPFITPNPFRVIRFNFEARRDARPTFVVMAPSMGGDANTAVFDANVPSHQITGHLFPAEIRIVAKFGDYDGDGDVDLRDAAMLQQCFDGPGGGVNDPYCAAGDFQKDNDVDLGDFPGFRNALTGP